MEPVKRRMVFHGRPQNDWCSLILALTSLWKNCGKSNLSAGLNPRSKPLMNRIERKQQLQFALACVWLVAVTTGIKSPLPFKEV